MQFDLVRVGAWQTRLEELLDVDLAEVAHADGACLALLAEIDERPPLVDALVGCQGCVDEVEVDVVEPQALETGIQRRHCRLVGLGRHAPGRVAGEQLGRDEQPVTTESGTQGGVHGSADTGLVPVDLGGVHMPVSRLQGRGDGVRCLAVADEIRAEADGREVDAVGDRDDRGRAELLDHVDPSVGGRSHRVAACRSVARPMLRKICLILRFTRAGPLRSSSIRVRSNA